MIRNTLIHFEIASEMVANDLGLAPLLKGRIKYLSYFLRAYPFSNQWFQKTVDIEWTPLALRDLPTHCRY